MRQARYRYRLYPSSEQAVKLNQTFGCYRVAYNWTLARRKEDRMTYAESDKAFFVHRKTDEMPWLMETSSSAQQQAIRDLQVSFKNFFDKRTGFPRFKSKRSRQTARFAGKSFDVRDGGLRLERISGLIGVRWSRELPSNPSSVTIERDTAGRYFASFAVVVNPDPLPVTTKQAGIDLGINDIFVTSDGYQSGNPRHLKRMEDRIAMLHSAEERTNSLGLVTGINTGERLRSFKHTLLMHVAIGYTRRRRISSVTMTPLLLKISRSQTW